MKRIVKGLIGLFATIILIGGIDGCQDSTSLESCTYDMDYKLDKGKYSEVLTMADGECGKVLQDAGDGDKLRLYKAASYLGKAGVSVDKLLGDVKNLSGSDGMSSLINNFAGVDAVLNINLAMKEYNAITANIDCNSSTLNDTMKASCALKNFISPIQGLATMSVLAGDDLTYNGKQVTAITALMDPASVGIKDDGTQTEFDVDGNGTLDSSGYWYSYELWS